MAGIWPTSTFVLRRGSTRTGGSASEALDSDAESRRMDGSDAEHSEDSSHFVERCGLCFRDIEQSDDDPLTTMDEVAVVKMKTFLNVSSIPKTASKFQWKRKKWVEMCVCTGGFYMAQYTCADKFILRPDCADVRGAWLKAGA